MANIKLFTNEQFGEVRFIPEGDSFFVVGKDVLRALGYAEGSIRNASDAFASVPDEWKGTKQICTPGGEQQMLCLSEQGLYFFLGRSDKPAALPYQKWIAGEVVPSIRKTGMYTLPDFNDPAAAARAWADAIDREKAERAEKEKAQAALQAEQSAHLDTQYDLLVTQQNLTELNDKYSASIEMGSVDDMRSAYDMQVALHKYFDTNKQHGLYGFWWYMSGFMHTYCNGGIRSSHSRGFEYALPGELTGHVYYMTKRGNTSVFPKRAWADVIAYFKNHQDSLKDLPCIGYAAR